MWFMVLVSLQYAMMQTGGPEPSWQSKYPSKPATVSNFMLPYDIQLEKEGIFSALNLSYFVVYTRISPMYWQCY